MKIVIALVVVFTISFMLLFKLVYSGNKQEPEDEKINLFLVIFVAFLLALFPTVAIALVLFVLLGSTSAVNMAFSLNISTNQLIMFAIALLVYLFSIDSIIELIVKHILGKNILYYAALLLIRIGAVHTIGTFMGLNQTISITIATGVAFIIFLIEILNHLKEKGKERDLTHE